MAGELTVGDYVTLQRGITYKGNLVGKPGPALLGLGSIIPGGGFREGDYKTYGGDCPPKTMLFPGDLFVSLKGATKDGKMIGSVARVPSSVASGRLTQDTVKLEFREPDREVSDFLYWILRTPQYRDYCAGRATGSAVVALSREDFLNYPIPPITETRFRIIDLLEAIEIKIELNRQMNATLEASARALFQSWFLDFDPVRAKLDGRKPFGMDAPTAALFPDSFEESELGQIPKGWAISDLGNHLGVLETGRRPKGGVSGFTEGIPSIGAESIHKVGEYDFAKTKYIPKEFFDGMKSGLVQDYDVLLYKDGGKPGVFLPRVSMFGEGFPFKTFAINEHVFRLRSDFLGQAFLYFQLSSERILTDMHNRGGKAAIPGINQNDVKTLRFLIPPDPILDSFNQTCDDLLKRILCNSSESRTLATLRDTLLPKLMSGELEIA